MALKAGYIGIKKSMLGLINSLASSKLIKSFGDGLNLTSAGKLNMTAATASKIGGIKVGDGLEIDDGVLNCTITGAVYSTDEFKTGETWTDGRDIYGKVYTGLNITLNSGGTSASITLSNIDDMQEILDVKAYRFYKEGTSVGGAPLAYTTTATGLMLYSITNFNNIDTVIIKYVKKEVNE